MNPDEVPDTDQFGRRYDGETTVVSVDLVTPELEAMARAMHEVEFRFFTPPEKGLWSAATPGQKSHMYDMARAALLAIREPTEGMKNCGAHAVRSQGPFEPAPAFRAMIDHVLGETDNG